MTTIEPVVQGDIGDTRTVILEGVEDLDAVAAIEAHVWRSGVAAVTLAAAVTDPTAREVTVELGGVSGWLATLDIDTNTRFKFEVETTWADGSVLTWPGRPAAFLDVLVEGA